MSNEKVDVLFILLLYFYSFFNCLCPLLSSFQVRLLCDSLQENPGVSFDIKLSFLGFENWQILDSNTVSSGF